MLYLLVNTFNCTKSAVSPAPSSDQGQSPAGKAVYPGGPGTKITSVSTGNLCADVSNWTIEGSGVFMWNSPPDETRVTRTLEDEQYLGQRWEIIFHYHSNQLLTTCCLFSIGKVSHMFSFHTVISGFIHQDEPSPPHPEAYPIPTQTYPREYFTIPASKSQDRVVGPGQGPSQHWQGMEDRERLPMVDNIHNSMQVEQHHQLVEAKIIS